VTRARHSEEGLATARRTKPVCVFVLLFAAAVGWQLREGSYGAECSANPDEAPHHITGLMVRDYVRSGFKETPLAGVRNYSDHYPKSRSGTGRPRSMWNRRSGCWSPPAVPKRSCG